MQYLKQSTAVTLKIGPFLDDTDGKTAETALTIAQADVRLSKNGGDIAQKNEATSCTHDELGIYGCHINATDTDTLGRLQLWVHESGALPVWHEYMVVPANVYDSLFSTDKLEVDLIQMGGVAQSATDLKDFADAGYDPATNKIEGCKVNDDMRGTDSAALASALTTHDGKLDTVDSVADAIKAKTDNLPADPADDSDIDAQLATIAGYLDTEVAAILADTGELQTDLADGGRLDLLIDAIKAKTDNLKDTWNDLSAANVNAEVDAALADIHLDHLLAVDTGASLPGVAGSIWHDLLEDDGGDWRFNANALEQAPSGGTNPNVLVSTTIASVTDQTHFVLTAGSNDDDAYKDQSIVLYDASDSDYPSVRKCTGYVGSTKTVTLDSAPDFTIIAGDGVKVFVTAPGTTAPTAAQNADAVWDELIADHTGAGSFGAKNQKVVPSETLADYKATGFSTHSAADVWTAANRALSTPNDYKADVSALALEATLTAMKGATFNGTTDSLEAIRNQGDAAWITATGFSTHSAADVWAVGTRTLTDKAGFSLSAAGITAIWDKDISSYSGAGYAGTYLKTLYDDWLNGGRLDLILDAIAADVVNLDGDAMRGTDNAALASVCTEARLAELAEANIPADIDTLLTRLTAARAGYLDELAAANLPADIDAILADTSTDGVVVASGSKTGYALSESGIDAIIDEVIEGTITLRQAQRLFLAVLTGKSAGGGTTTLTFRDVADAKNRITAIVDAEGNRTAMTLDGA